MANAPGVVIQEVPAKNTPITGANLSVAGMLAVTRLGEIATPTLVTSYDDFVAKFGEYDSRSDSAEQVRCFFEEGGSQLYVSRIASYSDRSDVTSHPGDVASLALDDLEAASTLTVEAKYPGTYGNSIEVEVEANPLVRTTLAVAAPSGSTSVFLSNVRGLAVGNVLGIELGHDAYDASSAYALANLLKSSYNAHRILTSGSVHAASDTTNITSGSDATTLASLLTLANELKTDLNAHFANATAHTAADSTNTISAPTATDLASAITLVNALKVAFEAHRVLTAGSVHGAADSANVANRVEYREIIELASEVSGGSVLNRVGLDSSLTSSFSTAATRVATPEFNLNIYLDGATSPTESFVQVSMIDSLSNYVETVVNDESTGSKLIVVSDEDSVSGGGLDRPVDLVRTALSGGAAEIGVTLSVLDVIGESVAKTGIHSFDETEINLLFICNDVQNVGTEGAVLKYAAQYCANRKDCFFIGGTPPDLDVASTISEIEAASINTSYAGIFFNRIKVLDRNPDSASTTKFIVPVGAVCGKMAQVDNLPGSGPWETPAGEAPFGNLVSAIGVERQLTNDNRAALNAINVNPMISVRNKGVMIFGGRTQDTNLEYRYINVRRTMMYIQQSIKQNMQGKVFRINNVALWTGVKNTITNFLGGLRSQGALKGQRDAEAFYVKVGELDGVQTTTNTNNGELIAEVGVAISRPAEFLIFRFSQIGTDTTVE